MARQALDEGVPPDRHRDRRACKGKRPGVHLRHLKKEGNTHGFADFA